jgi:hypothetical protein
MPAPKHDEQGRVATMVAAHVVYGAVLGFLTGGGLVSLRRSN